MIEHEHVETQPYVQVNSLCLSGILNLLKLPAHAIKRPLISGDCMRTRIFSLKR